MSSQRVLRVGVVGAGFLARTRARCWKQVHAGRVDGLRVELAGVSSRTPATGAAFATEHGFTRHFETAEELLASDEIDLVDLCVPNKLHRPLAERAAAAGKAILCTKPLAAYVGQDLDNPAEAASTPRAQMLDVALGDARAMVRAAEEHDVLLCYGENWACAPAIEKAIELGTKARARILDMRGWECHSGSHTAYSADWGHTGGGALLRLGAHPVGAMLWLKRLEGLARDGQPVRPVAVTGEVADPRGASDSGPGVEGWGTLIIAFEDGSRGVAIGADTMLGGMQSRLVVLAGDHHLECNLSPHDGLRAYGRGEGVFGDAYIMEKVDGQAGWSTPIPNEDWSSGQQGLCQRVAEAAVSRGETASGAPNDAPSAPAVPDGQLGLDVVRCIYAGYQSAEEGRRIQLINGPPDGPQPGS